MQAFLFTDIESSTRLWEEHPDEMPDALTRHDELLAACVEDAGGTVVKTTGDGLVAVFASETEALQAAVRAQSEFSEVDWGPTGPLRVRMGVHGGETESRSDDFFGPVMNRTARIMAAGHGGQILLSGVVADLLSGTLPEGVNLRDLGFHRLKDLTLPEHLYQAVITDIPSEFPAPLTLDSRPHNLPVQATEFLGRANELTAIGAMLDAPNIRLLTIAGPGGAGKTRLGLQVAADQFDHFPDGVFFVDVSAERDPDAAFEAVVRALGLPAGGGDALQILKTRLRDLKMLLLLDNFEQVTVAGTGIAELLQAAPGLKVVVTSRETLRVRPEFVFPVPPLSLPDPSDDVAQIAESEAAQLFVERAGAVRPGFALDAENARVVAEICLRLDGLPLAIELAAARLNVFTPKDLLARLRKRLDVLGAGGRDVPDRQRTLWGAIAWSYELLDARERDLFDLLAVFSSTGLDSIEAVAEEALGSFDVDSLASLVDKSLVQTDSEDGSTRFAMLLMIKEYSEERLAENPEREHAVKRAHALHFSAFAQELNGRLNSTDRDAALSDLSTEIGNLRTAWRFWVDQGDLEQLFLLIDGLWALHEARGWYHAAIELASDTLRVLGTAESTPELKAEELVLRTSLARALMAVRGYGVGVEVEFKKVLAAVDAGGSAGQRFPVLRTLSTFYMNTSNFEAAAAIGRQLLEMAEEDPSILIDAHYVFGAGTAFAGDLETGLRHLDTAIELFDPKIHGVSRYRLGPNIGVVTRVASGLLLWQCGDIERSVERVTECLELSRDLDHPFTRAYALYHNGFLAMTRYRFDECIQFAHELSEIANANEYLVWKTLATFLEGTSMTALGQIEEGLIKTETAIDLYQGLTTPPVFWPLILSVRAMVHAMAGLPERALEIIDEAIGLGGAAGVVQPEFLILRGDFLTMLPNPDLGAAEIYYRTAADNAAAGGVHLLGLQALTRLVGLRRELNLEPDGTEELAQCFDRFTSGFTEHDLVAAKALLD